MINIFSKIVPSDIPNHYHNGFQGYILQQNLRNTTLFSWLMLGIHLLFLLTDLFHCLGGDWISSPSYKTLFYFHLAVYPIFGTVLMLSRFFEKQIAALSERSKYGFVMGFVFASAVWFVGVAVYDQLLHEKITLYIMYILVPGVVFTLNKHRALIAQLFGYGLLAIGLFVLQPDQHKMIGHLVNGAGFAVIGYFVAFYYYRSRARDYMRGQLLKEKTQQLREVNEEMKEVNKELKEVNEELKKFVYAVSHDLKAPLRMVNSFTHLLKRSLNGSLKGDTKEYMDYISNGTKRMDVLLDDLRDYAMVNKGGLATQVVDLNLVVEQVMDNLHVNIKESEAHIIVEKLPTVHAVFTHILQLFQNLISNAIKFRKNTPPNIVIQSEERLNDYLISISDNGIGIEKEYVNQVFTLFKRLHTEEEYEGTGIGLAICQKIINNYGGQIWLESTPNKGTIFYFTFPKLAA